MKDMEYRKVYNRNVESKFNINFDAKFMDSSFWHRIHEHLTRHQYFTICSNK